MAKLSVKKGDNVMVITGKDQGKVGKVLKVVPDTGRIYVEGVNIIQRAKSPETHKKRAASSSKKAQSMHPTLCMFAQAAATSSESSTK